MRYQTLCHADSGTPLLATVHETVVQDKYLSAAALTFPLAAAFKLSEILMPFTAGAEEDSVQGEHLSAG